MVVLCFSRTVSLRCAGLTRTEGITLIIPPAIQFIASFFLARKSLGHTKRKNSLIFIEAFVFFGLAIADFALHITLPDSAMAIGVGGFSLADRAIGALGRHNQTKCVSCLFLKSGIITFIPILSYTLFLFLFLNLHILPFLPPLFHAFFKYILAALIPLIIAFDELGSLLGMAYGSVDGSLAQGFLTPSAQYTAHVFTTTSLTLFFVVQFKASIVCGPLLSRMARIRKLGGAIPGTYPAATIWLALGITFGACDTLVGFVDESFAAVLTRRILMASSRVLVIIALIQ